MQSESVVKIEGKVKIELRDAQGNIVRLWNENKLGKFLRLKFNDLGFRYLGAYGLRLPGFGKWGTDLAFSNIITSAGLAAMASRCNGDGSVAVFGYLAVGTGTNAADISDTTLQSEITDSGLARAAATVSRVTTTVTNDTAQFDKVWSVTGTKAITEVGVLNASSLGVLLGRQVFSAINVVNTYVFQITYKFKFS